MSLVSRRRAPEPTFTILVVCTGNICRSALAERLGRAYVAERLGEQAGNIELTSAGTGAVVDSAMHPDSALVLSGFGGDPEGFRARQLEEHTASHADLTLTMTRAHRRRVLELSPRALSRTFTLREAADLVELVEPPVTRDGEDLATRGRALVSRLHEARSRRQSDRDGDDVPDPIGRPIAAHQYAGDLIADSLLRVLGRVADLRPSAAENSRTDAA